jgi:hypothetical protein
MAWLGAACGDVTVRAPAAACDDGLLNGNESAIDCGGSCGPCAFGQACRSPADCATSVCDAGLCACLAGFAPDSDGACQDLDDCTPNPCENGGLCQDRINSFACSCVPGYSGPTCAVDDDDCSPNPCKNGGVCSDAVNDYSCECATGFWGADCAQACDVGHCVAGTVSCTAGGVNRSCTACEAGYTGPACDDDLDECATGTHACAPGASCTNTVGGYDCACPAGTTGDGLTCSGCPTGTWGEGCGEVCRQGSCLGDVTCAAADGGERQCDACEDGWMGAGCDEPCDAAGCAAATAVCAQDGSERLCPLGCAPGRWGADCDAPCPGYNCDHDALGYIVCAQDTGYSQACGACIAGWSGVSCQTLCDQADCVGVVSCDQQDPHAARRCPDGCAPGHWGEGCEATCEVPHCALGPICAQATGDELGCGACHDGWWGAACASACATPAHCVGTTRCAQATGAAAACDGCEAGWAGATCEAECIILHCTGESVCDQATSTPESCSQCEDGWFGPTCERPCAVDGCASGARCDQVTGAAVGCETCAPGRWGDACGGLCGSEACAGDVTCVRDSGGLAACDGCVDGRWGPICESSCSLDHCIGEPTCDQASGTPTGCAQCAPGFWGATCQKSCDATGCAGVASCAQDTGAPVACSLCEAGRWGATCGDTCGQGGCAGAMTCDQATGAAVSCSGCTAGRWGATCDASCAQGQCAGTVTCDQTSGVATACPGGCAAGRFGATCDATCADDHCVGTVRCHQDTGATTSCAACRVGWWGGACAAACPTGPCAGGVACDQANGVVTACATCQPGWWGATCGASCAAGHCAGTVTCDKASGGATSCAACAVGFWGATCDSACPQGRCVGAVTCAKADGAATSCASCAAGWWDPACGTACSAENCDGTITCAQATGTVTACSDCVPGWLGPMCDSYALTSCLDWLDAGQTGSGRYVVDPDGLGAIPASAVWCDQVTDGGGYTFYKAVAPEPLNAAEAEAFCAARGMRLFIPRTAAHLHSAWEVANSSAYGADATNEYLYILGIYPETQGATCAHTPLQRGNPACAWRAGDDGSFWVSDRTDVPNPSGDNAVDGSMYYTFDAAGDVSWYDDGPSPGFSNARFMCDLGDKDFHPTSCVGWRDAGFVGDGVYRIDPDGAGAIAPYDVVCDMSTTTGGWTLVATSSDDGVNTWTWNKRALFTTNTASVGSVSQPTRDFKSRALHDLKVRDLLFVHRPSGVTAEYRDVEAGTRSLAAIIAAAPSPNCSYALAGQGYPLTGGSLTAAGSLCDTDLYFNLGDHETSLTNCQSLNGGAANATYGPAWSAGFNNGCPFDDPSVTGFGPTPQCGGCGATIDDEEQTGRGFGAALGLNTGAAGTGANALQVFVR